MIYNLLFSLSMELKNIRICDTLQNSSHKNMLVDGRLARRMQRGSIVRTSPSDLEGFEMVLSGSEKPLEATSRRAGGRVTHATSRTNGGRL